MLSTVSRARTSYICTQCRTRLLARPTTAALLLPNLSRRAFPVVSRRLYATESASAPDPQTSPDVPKYEEELDLSHAQFGPQTRPWERIGLRPVVADTLLRAFPNVIRPTSVQKKLLTALSYGYSVAVRGLPGTGKSFAIAAWLLGLERSIMSETKEPTTSALVIVPNVDLAMQYHSTILAMLENSDSEAVKSSPDAFVQVLYRRGTETELEQLQKLKEFRRPHIIIAPPTIILDILADTDPAVRKLIDINHLKVIVLEEIDATITQMVFYSRIKKGQSNTAKVARTTPRQMPLQILLDYIVKCRIADAHRKGIAPQQPQLVFPSATLSATQVKRFLVHHHRQWLQPPQLNMDTAPATFSGAQPGEEWRRKARSNSLLSIEDPPLEHNEVTQYVPDHLHHHVLAYDVRTRKLRDAPLPALRHLSKEDIVAELNKTEKMVQDAIQDEDTVPEGMRVAGYPQTAVTDIVMKLLEKDNYPTNVLVGLSLETDFPAVKQAFRDLGMHCRMLLAVKWNTGDELGKLPIGRTDMLLSPSVRHRIEAEAKGGDKSATTIWLTSTFYCRGIHPPGANHLYILHRITRPREYITYAGRVASWPFARRADELADPLSAGMDRRPQGKIVSVILEDNVLEHADKEPRVKFKKADGKTVKSMVVRRDGGTEEEVTWSTEAVRLAKLGCKVEPYFADVQPAEGAVEGGEAAAAAVAGQEVKEEGVTPVQEEKKDFLMEAMGLLDDFEAAEEEKRQEEEEEEEKKKEEEEK
ncbi:uncharacterized protein H6S33_000720 [Morchella sextelata]|uniref:uncharacterized protein n=1 Tax=Morchella sextelata TaxID=1174677 RepID=UPI001D04BB7C|nr:uncharacterized protein H6S33_000720 [Morchella sextelata]KAH0615084.1 hypothetical protein H6S33_000720 [Morchella sextelata]